jgi:hypothetical protein
MGGAGKRAYIRDVFREVELESRKEVFGESLV